MAAPFLGSSHAAPAGEAHCVIIPVPFDATTCYKAGARDGPAAVIAASPHMELYDEDARCEGWRWGIHTDREVEPLLRPEAMCQEVESRVEEWLEKGRFPVVLGGDHSVSIGAIRAAARHRPGLLVVQFDAHTDLRASYQGSPYSHACVMRRALEVASICQVGIRSLSGEEAEFLEAEGLEPIWAREVWEDLGTACGRLERAVAGRPVYLTIDLDCLDPSIMPAVGTPEPGGIQWYPLLELMKRVIQGAGAVMGLDLVELAPVPGLHAADYLAARLLYKIISLLYARA